ncbi:MAG: tetratricopeptide repeat-containing sulfotransferase family protein [Steroidobacteraceae bacterium]
MITSLIRSIEADPMDLPAYCMLARSYESSGEFRKAELTLRRAIEIDPLHHEAWLQLGILYTDLGDWGSSVDAFEQACALNPGDPTSHIGHGLTLIATKNIEGAMRVCTTLLGKFSDRSESHLIEGHIRKTQGLSEKAAESYRRALQVDAHQSEALFNLVDLFPPAPSDPLTERLEQLRRNPSLSQGEAANVCFALARIYETGGQVEMAFTLLQEANVAASAMMRRLGNAYSPGDIDDETRELVETFTVEVFASQLEPLDLNLRLIFVVGLPRSGTTLVEQILGSHTHIITGGELPFMQECLSKLLAGRRFRGKHGPLDLEDDEERRLLLRLREEYLDRIFERELDGEYVIDKLPANFGSLGLIRVLFPNAILIHCTRDPIATCWSMYSANFGIHLPYYTSLEHLVHFCRNYQKLMTHWESVLRSEIVPVSYEGLVLDPETGIRELVRSCGLPWEDACLKFYASKLPIYTVSAQQARQRIFTSSVSRWRKFEQYLSPLIDGLSGARTG